MAGFEKKAARERSWREVEQGGAGSRCASHGGSAAHPAIAAALDASGFAYYATDASSNRYCE